MKRKLAVDQHGKAIAVTWEQHRRTRGVSAGLGVPLFELTYRGGRLARYAALLRRTIALLRRERPDVLIVQNPSLILALIALMLRSIGRYRLVVDAHNEAVQPFIHTSWPVPQLARLLLARADITIVTNSVLAKCVEESGGTAFVLPDRLPDVAVTNAALPRAGHLDVMVIATYAPDEPIASIFAAAASLQDSFRFHVTGNDRKMLPSDRSSVPSNVRLTGFLPEHDYWELMQRCHIVLDLTQMPDCLVCGAYEALAMCKPMVLSDNRASRELFSSVAEFCSSAPRDIELALRRAGERYEELTAVAPLAKHQFAVAWRSSAVALGTALHGA